MVQLCCYFVVSSFVVSFYTHVQIEEEDGGVGATIDVEWRECDALRTLHMRTG